jgi:hypothetical protein
MQSQVQVTGITITPTNDTGIGVYSAIVQATKP